MSHIFLFVGIILTLLFLLYRWALPKPIPGIPYNKESAGRLLGDVPNLIAAIKRHGDVFLWFRDQNIHSGSVINQVFSKPFGKPVVIVADAHETRDILVNRSVEFDRTIFLNNLFRPIIGQGQITFPTGSAWKSQRRLSQDTMSARFLMNVAAPNIHASCSIVVQLWEQKARLANGSPFNAESDLFHATPDAVTVVTFGSQYPYRAVQPKLKALVAMSVGEIERGPRLDNPVVFPDCKIDDELDNIIKFIERVEAVQSMGIQDFGWYFEMMTTRYKTLKKAKDECVRREVAKALERMKDLDEATAEETARHGVDLIVNRERIMAAKEKRQPDYFGEAVFGAIVGGYDTSSPTMCWTVKLLSKERAKQTALREALQSAYVAALEEHRQPNVEEVLNTPIPYLDAAIEELFRLCAVVPMNSRQALRDTEVLGHPIPKGTVVLHLTTGPGFTMPPYHVDEKLRRSAGKANAVKSWDNDDVSMYKPERWLKYDASGAAQCDPNAGPSNGFGMGLRSCFGKRLAYMNFRLQLVSVIWNFELMECPDELSSTFGKFGVVYKPQQTYVRLRKVEL